jgi:hypothetical protein
MGTAKRRKNIFVNCPFDPEFQPIFRAVLFTTVALGFTPRSALEVEDSSVLRLRKIFELVRKCRFALHDLSRTELSRQTNLPRFNMALELGIFLGAKEFGEGRLKNKGCVIFAKDDHAKTFVSDINGMDIKGHGDSPAAVIAPIRDWLCNDAGAPRIPSSVLEEHFQRFEADLPKVLAQMRYKPEEPKYGDLLTIVCEWLPRHPVEQTL